MVWVPNVDQRRSKGDTEHIYCL